MVLAREPLRKLRACGFENLEPATLELNERFFSANEPQGSAALRARFGQDQCAIREIECSEADLAGDFGGRFQPPQPARDHQMDDEEEIVFQLEDDSLPHAANPGNRLSFHRTYRRIE